MSTIPEIWQAIEEVRAKSNEYGSDFPMNPPATPDRLEQGLARAIGFAIPSQLQESLLIHDGMDRFKGCWFQGLIPLSAEAIEAAWRDDRQRESEANNEGDEWVKPPNLIPIMSDSTLHHEIYMDAIDGSVLNYVVDGGWHEEFRYPNYADFLEVVLKHLESGEYFEWPAMKR